MNKKKLSVVMAGAMLASSVSPVLAATVEKTELDQNELGSLVVKVYDKLTSKLYSDTSSTSAQEIFGGVNVNSGIIGRSVYTVKIGDTVVPNTANIDLTTEAGKADLKNKLQEAFKVLTAGQKVTIVSKGFDDVNGYTLGQKQVYATYAEKDFDNGTTMKNAIVNALANDDNATLTDGNVNKNLLNSEGDVTVTHNTSAVIKFVSNTNDRNDKNDINLSAWATTEGYEYTHNATGQDELTIKPGQKKLDFSKVVMADGTVKDITDAFPKENDRADVKGFAHIKEYVAFDEADKTVAEEITITGKENNFKTEDLYDGLMLTTAGHDLLTLVKESRDKARYNVNFTSIDGTDIVEGAENISLSLHKGEYGFNITVTDAFGTKTVYTIKGDKKATETLASWLNTELAKVDILAGSNRYETAVQIAKEQASIKPFVQNGEANIVLVNGKALVDGLSASPLAAVKNAPVLLTAADSLPKETKEYIKELLYNKSGADLDSTANKVTVHLVGGRSVLSTSLENELEDMGLKVRRYNGDNREETSLKVADEIGNTGNNENNVFVVGADGEADAMSIAGVASTNDANNNNKVTPIIVSKRGGLSDDALDYLSNKDITVIGGELVVSKADYEALEENVGNDGTVRRIAGENRQATNAAIIKTFYHTDGIVNGKVESVVVAKDGRGNKDELVDALASANLAVQKKAPIVLAKSSLSEGQLDALNLRAKSSKSLYQVGEGVERSVVETLAKHLGLSNLK